METSDPIKLKQKMSAKDLQLLHMEYEKQKKSTGLAYFLWLFLGGFGVHQAYLGRTDWAGFHFVAMLFFIAMWFTLDQTIIAIGGFGIILSGLKLLYDLFFLGDQVKKTNAKIEAKIIYSIQN